MTDPTEQPTDPIFAEVFDTTEDVHKDRREHGGAPARLDDDELAHRTEEERGEVGVDDYDPDDVPPATD